MAAFSTAMIDSNLLKIAGAFVAGLAGIIGILGQTRTQDNKRTRSGKWLFGMAILGVVLAVGTQIWEWRKTIESNRAALQRNEQVLQEIRRAVTRFQKVSVDWSITFQSTNKVFGSYIGDLAKLAEDALSKPWSFGFGRSNQGLSAKPVGVGAAYQRWIAKGERSGLWTHIVMRGSVSLCTPTKS